MCIRIASSFFLTCLLFQSLLFAQAMEIPRASPKALISQTIGVCTVTLNYSRPSTRGREIMGKVVPFQQVWRAGANEATILSFDYPLTIGEAEVPPGKYGLFMIPDAGIWTVILNREWNQWGAYNYDPEKDVLRIEIAPQKIDHTEMCTFTFTEVNKSSGLLNLEWEQARISIPLKTQTHIQTLQEINQAVAVTTQNWYVYSAAAQYHFYERKEAEQALAYINVAIALNAPNPAPWMLKSQILASQAKYHEAIQAAEAAIEVSKQHNFLFELEENEENIHKWKGLEKE